MRRRLPRVLLLLALLALPLVLLQIDVVRGWLVSLVAYLHRAGPLGLFAFLGAEILAMLLAAPMWVLSGVAGYVYGFPTGFFVALPGVTISACAAFLAGRALLRRALAARAGESRFWSAVHRAVRVEGLKITLLLRVTFAIPQALVSYVLSTTPLRLREFALGTLVGLGPATLFHVYVGSLVESAAALVAGKARAQGPLAWAASAVGLALTVAGLLVTSRVAKRALARALEVPREGELG